MKFTQRPQRGGKQISHFTHIWHINTFTHFDHNFSRVSDVKCNFLVWKIFKETWWRDWVSLPTMSWWNLECQKDPGGLLWPLTYLCWGSHKMLLKCGLPQLPAIIQEISFFRKIPFPLTGYFWIMTGFWPHNSFFSLFLLQESWLIQQIWGERNTLDDVCVFFVCVWVGGRVTNLCHGDGIAGWFLLFCFDRTSSPALRPKNHPVSLSLPRKNEAWWDESHS